MYDKRYDFNDINCGRLWAAVWNLVSRGIVIVRVDCSNGRPASLFCDPLKVSVVVMVFLLFLVGGGGCGT